MNSMVPSLKESEKKSPCPLVRSAFNIISPVSDFGFKTSLIVNAFDTRSPRDEYVKYELPVNEGICKDTSETEFVKSVILH